MIILHAHPIYWKLNVGGCSWHGLLVEIDDTLLFEIAHGANGFRQELAHEGSIL